MSSEEDFKGHRGPRIVDLQSAISYANYHAREIGIGLTVLVFVYVMFLQPPPPPIYVDDATGQVLSAAMMDAKGTLPAHVLSDVIAAPTLAGKVDALVAENRRLMAHVEAVSTQLRELPHSVAKMHLSAKTASTTSDGSGQTLGSLSAPGDVDFKKTDGPTVNPYSWRGQRMGSFAWDTFRFEKQSSARLFWVKTANNEEGHHLYRRLLITNGWMETSDPKTPNCVLQVRSVACFVWLFC